MRHFLNFISATILTICSHNFLFAQVDTSIVLETKIYAKQLDSLDKLPHPQDFGFMTSIADGIIKKDDIVVGGFGVYTLSNAKGDTALRIEYHDNLDINIYKTYYFKNNKLIFAIVELQDGRDNMKSIYHKEEIYAESKIIWTITQKEKKANIFFDKTNFALYDDGLKFLADFMKENNRR